MQSKHCLTSVTLPDSVTIFSTNINVQVNEVSHRELSNLTESRTSLEALILRNHSGKTGYLMWILSYCITCIYQQKTKVKQLFSLLTYEDSHSPAIKQTIHIHGVDNLVEEIDIIQNKQECQTMEYDIQFICCSCKITKIERKHIMRKHRKNILMTVWNPLPIGIFSIVFCIASYSIFFSPVAWHSSGPKNNHWRFYLNLRIP